jgi:hypothetical protein
VEILTAGGIDAACFSNACSWHVILTVFMGGLPCGKAEDWRRQANNQGEKEKKRKGACNRANDVKPQNRMKPPLPTIPALTPSALADALAALAKRDGIALSLRSHYGQPAEWHMVEVSPCGRLVRSAGGLDYQAALDALRAAKFVEVPK